MIIHPQTKLIREPRLMVPRQKPVGPVRIDRKHNLARNLICYIPFLETSTETSSVGDASNATVARDYTPNNHNLLKSDIDYEYNPRVAGTSRGQMFFWDGTATKRRCRLQNTEALKLYNSPFTLSAWVWLNTGQQQHMILQHGQNYLAYASWYLSIGGSEGNSSPGYYSVGYGPGGMTEASNHAAYTGAYAEEKVWTHVCGTLDGSALKLYLNGAIMATTSVSGYPGNSSIITGVGGDFGRFYWDGAIDDLRIYNRCLSAGEVNEIYKDPCQFLIPA